MLCLVILINIVSNINIVLCFQGVVHFAGSTHGKPTSTLCEHPLQYPHFTQGALPLFLSVLHSLNRICPDVAVVPKSCYEAVDIINDHIKSSNGTLKVTYNPGAGRFMWPPHRVKLSVNLSSL